MKKCVTCGVDLDMGPHRLWCATDLPLKVTDYHQKKHDSGKVRMDLVPLDVMVEIARVFTFGCTPKEEGGAGYEENSWKDVPDGYKRYKAADLRHLAAAENEDLDPESQLYHLAHHAWNACALLWFKIHGKAPGVKP